MENAGALRNGLKRLELVKVGLIAHPMQNSSRNMIVTLFFMLDGVMVSKLSFLGDPQAGISIWWASSKVQIDHSFDRFLPF